MTSPLTPKAVIPISEELVHVEKTKVAHGRITVRTVTDTFSEIAAADLKRGRIDIKKIRVNRQIDRNPGIRTEGDLTIIPVIKEILYTEKRLMLVEEIHVRRSLHVEHVERPIELRRQRVVIEKMNKPSKGD